MTEYTPNEADLRCALNSDRYTLMSIDELRCLLPANHGELILTGTLQDGRYFSPRFRNTYFCVFDNREAYIHYYVEHYFSHTNIGRSGTIRALLNRYHGVPLELVVRVGRLASINTTEEELRSVIERYSEDLMIFTDSQRRNYVKRIDNFDGNVFI